MRRISSARLNKSLASLAETFWLLPAMMVLLGFLGALGSWKSIVAASCLPSLMDGPWLYNGGGTGARTLLGAVA